MAAAEIHVPISPTPGFLAQVHALAASLRRHGGALADARIVVTVSRDHDEFDIPARHPWALDHAIEWRWIEPELFEQTGIFGTALRRFTYEFDAPFVLMLDADTLARDDPSPMNALLRDRFRDLRDELLVHLPART